MVWSQDIVVSATSKPAAKKKAFQRFKKWAKQKDFLIHADEEPK